MNKVIAWDLEIVKEIPEGVEWREIRPLGISCASVLLDRNPLSELYYHKDDQNGDPVLGAMTKKELQDMVIALENYVKHMNYTLVTWNGLGFDFDVLAEESGMYEECKELAMNHIDMMFQFFCIKGFPVGLDATAKGMGLGGKMAGMSGAQAPQLWESERLQDRLRVLRYVHQDAVSTLEVYEKTTELNLLSWITKKDKLSTISLFDGWKTVKECLDFPVPDTSWMKDTSRQLYREDFYSWIK